MAHLINIQHLSKSVAEQEVTTLLDFRCLPGEVGIDIVCAFVTLSATATLRAEKDARFLVLGGAPLDGPRKIWWNFVASSRERIEEAKERWRKREFPEVPGEGPEFVPLPE